MKNLILGLSVLTIFSCSTPLENTENAETTTEEVVKNCVYVYDYAASKIEFGAFKTTEKLEVKGAFESFDVLNTNTGGNFKEVFENAEFKIYVNSLETKDAGRNQRIRDHFFGELLSKDTLSGKIVKIDSAEVEVELSMNKISKNVILKIEQNGNEYMLTGAINVLDWKADKGLKGINDACKDLHKGADGVSKTWADVNLYISTVLKEKCD
jgi:polyisoprenoid-binding protein YceI